MSRNWKKKAEKRNRKNKRLVEELEEPTDDNPDTRPDDDPIKIKGQQYAIFSFIVNNDEYVKNNGLIDPFKDIIFKISGSFNTYEQAQAFGKKLAAAYNETHKDKLYHNLFYAPLRKWSLFPDSNKVMADPDDPDKVIPLVNLSYEQDQIKDIMKSVRKEIDAEKEDHTERIKQTKKLGKEGKSTESELISQNEIMSNIHSLIDDDT